VAGLFRLKHSVRNAQADMDACTDQLKAVEKEVCVVPPPIFLEGETYINPDGGWGS